MQKLIDEHFSQAHTLFTMQSLEFRAMNTGVFVAAEGDEDVMTSLVEVRDFIQDCERRFSRFLPDSELSCLNRNAGEWGFVSSDLMYLLVQSLTYFEETGGLFDPSMLTDLKRVGYNESLELVRARRKTDQAASQRMPRPAFDAVEFDSMNSRVRLPAGMEIDLGGIAKGWIARHAAELLSLRAAACAVSAGGDICFVGWPADGSKWSVELEDPRDANNTLAVLAVGPGAVVTSSISKRTWTQNGQKRHHIIDPRTGEPAKADWLSVTVIAPRMEMAEVYAKALLIGGEGQRIDLTKRHPEMAFIAVDALGQIMSSENSREYFTHDSHPKFWY